MIDVKQIIEDSLKAFESSKERYADLPKVKDYERLHPKPLTPLNVKIDVDAFKADITRWDAMFEQWGNEHTNLPRYGIPLVNRDGYLLPNDPTNGSLMAYSKQYPDKALLETDCRTPTAVMLLRSLDPIDIFKGYWCRSNVLKWEQGAKFMPHIDTVQPSPWIRLWATTDPIELNFYNTDGNKIAIDPIELGRVYVIDTSLVHDAENISDNTVYQLFLSVSPDASELVASQMTK